MPTSVTDYTGVFRAMHVLVRETINITAMSGFELSSGREADLKTDGAIASHGVR